MFTIREGVQKNTFFSGDLSQMWVGGVADSQTRSKPLKTPQIPENRIFDRNFTYSFLKSHKNPGVCEWVNTFRKNLQKNASL